MRRAVTTTALVLAMALTATVADAESRPPLRDVAQVDDGLLVLALADEMRKRCDDIDARMIRALGYINSLKANARDLGYSKDEIEDYVTSKSEKRRMRARGEAWMSARGVTPSDTAGLCSLGRTEIDAGTDIGALLRAK